ncbi:MAG: IPT/TIG domain-containing protein [Candidatus Latescibacterota bacterium]
MCNSGRKLLPLALALVVASVGVAFGFDNENVVITLTTPAEVSGIGAGGTVQVGLSAAGMVGVRQFEIILAVDPADAFTLPATAFVTAAPFTGLGATDSPAAGQVRTGAAYFVSPAGVSGDNALGTFTLTASGTMTAQTAVTISVFRVALGPTSATRDIFTAADLGLAVQVNPPAPAPTVASIAPNSGSLSGGTAVTIVGSNFDSLAAVTIGGVAATGVTVVSADTLAAVVPQGAAAGAVDVVVRNSDGQTATLAGGFTYLAVIEPTLAAVGPTDRSLDYSAVGTGDVDDDSDGEVTFTVSFTDATGAAAAGQAVSFAITNDGAQSVYLLGAQVTEISAGESQTVSVQTGANGRASIVLDAEGGDDAGTTSATVAATTTASNSDGVSRNLGPVNFAATWDVPVVAELASLLGAVMPGDRVLLQWTVASQTNNLGWEVFRSVDNVTFERVGDLVRGDGTSDELKAYTFEDGSLPVADVLYYYLNQVDLDGTTARSAVVEVTLGGRAAAQALPTANALLQNYPNPFNPGTTIGYDLTQTGAVSLTVYDVNGQVVHSLVDGQTLSAGHYQSVWDGTDQSGQRVASGVYFYALRAAGFTSVKRMLLLQ